MDALLTLIMRPLVKMQMDGKVPFAKVCGVRLLTMGNGFATCELKQRSDLQNAQGHVAEGALFTLAETCSGAAMAGGFASVILGVRPVAAQVEFTSVCAANGDTVATARVVDSIVDLKQKLAKERKINFPVQVEVNDSTGKQVARMVVTWNLKKN